MTTQQEQSKFLENKDNTTVSPKQPFFQNCCCCSLRTGNLIYGWTFTVLSVLLLIMWIVFLGITISAASQTNTDSNSIAAIILFGILVFATLVSIAAYSLLLIGVYKKKPNCLKAFVIVIIICVVISFISQVYQFSTGGFTLQNVLTTVINIGLNILAILYVNSYRIQLTNELDGYPQPSNSNV